MRRIFTARNSTEKNRSKWDADSNRYAPELTAKTKPHCLILFRHGGFFFSWLIVQSRCEQRTGTPISVAAMNAATTAEVLQS
jgi:hypothetical protein